MSFTSSAQYNNSWIDYTQRYYKIPVSQSGVYRIDYNHLQSIGFPTSTVDPRWISIYHRGIEQAIIVTGQQDANFDLGDYIEFYGTKNDGTLDKQLYVTPETQPHNHYNLYSDTTAYFLTWTTGVNGKRMATYKSNNVDGLIPEDYQVENRVLINTEQYATGYSYGDYIQFTDFDIGEGWSGIALQEGQFIDYGFSSISNTVVG
ncbi:MAG: transporter, partial [Cyclobacteriaceae bacterium]|nr:transporter [Cyclobacteriaceae bacterium]